MLLKTAASVLARLTVLFSVRITWSVPAVMAFSSCSCSTVIGKKGQLLVQVAHVGDVHTQRFQVFVQQLFGLGISALLLFQLFHSFRLVAAFLVLIQPPVKLPRLLLLHGF